MISIQEQLNAYALIELSTFSYCGVSSSAEMYGGALMISYINIVLHNVCGFQCSSTFHDGFSNIYSISTKGVNSILDCSITRCKAVDYYTMFNQNGNINVSFVNFSYNNALQTSAILCWPTTSFSGKTVGCIVSYCSLAHNNASLCKCIYTYGFTEYEIEYTNIIYNEQAVNQNNGLIRSDEKSTIRNSCIIKNIGSPIFHNTNNEFILIGCYVDSGINSYLGKPPNIVQIGTKTFINQIEFISYGSCEASLDYIRIPTFEENPFIRRLVVNYQIIANIIE